jgi:hypothetical protein
VSWSLAELDAQACQRGATEGSEKMSAPDKTKGTHPNRLEICVPVGIIVSRAQWNMRSAVRYLLVISKVVPKIWARTNSAILTELVLRAEYVVASSG